MLKKITNKKILNSKNFLHFFVILFFSFSFTSKSFAAITGTGTGPFTITGTETTLNIYNYVVGQNSANASKNSDNTAFDFNVVLLVGDGTTTTVWNSSEESVRIDSNSFQIRTNATLNIGLSNPARGGSYWRWQMGSDQFVINGNLNVYASRVYSAGRVNTGSTAIIYFEESLIAFLDSITNNEGANTPTITYVRCYIAGATAVAVKLGGNVSLTGTKISGAFHGLQLLASGNSPAAYTVTDFVSQSNANDALPNLINAGQLNIVGLFDGAGSPKSSITMQSASNGTTVRLQWKYNLTSLYSNAAQSGTNVRIRNLNNTVVYSGQTNASGVIPQQILTRFEYINSPTGTARYPYQVKLRKYDRTSQDLVYNADNHTTQQAVHIAVPYLTLTEAQALALTGIAFTPSGSTGGTVTISSARTVAELWQAYRAWISQTANFDSEDTWSYDGETLNMGAWSVQINTGGSLTNGKLITTGAVTINGGSTNTSYFDQTGDSVVNFTGMATTSLVQIFSSTGSVLASSTNILNYRYLASSTNFINVKMTRIDGAVLQQKFFLLSGENELPFSLGATEFTNSDRILLQNIYTVLNQIYNKVIGLPSRVASYFDIIQLLK